MIGLNAFSGSVIVNDVNAECNYEVRTSKNILNFPHLSLCFFSKCYLLFLLLFLSLFMLSYPFLEIFYPEQSVIA